MQRHFMQNKDSLLYFIRQILPKWSPEAHKGLSGRVGVVGGSREYTGAPYFSAISALRTGCDLSYVFCASEASVPIKCYSPELIVLPGLNSVDVVKTIVADVLNRLHAIVIGPGLGRDDSIGGNIKMLFEGARKIKIPIVVDADGLYFVTQDPTLVQGYSAAVLTPNVVEFGRLYQKLMQSSYDMSSDMDCQIKAVSKLAQILGCTIVKKGREDIISDGSNVLISDLPGSVRRCGGQGDLLSGSLGTFIAWSFNHKVAPVDGCSPQLLASLAASLLTRKCNSLAFAKKKHSMMTSDMIEEIGIAFSSLYVANDHDD